MGFEFIDGPGGYTLTGKEAERYAEACNEGYSVRDAVRLATGKGLKKPQPLTDPDPNATRR